MAWKVTEGSGYTDVHSNSGEMTYGGNDSLCGGIPENTCDPYTYYTVKVELEESNDFDKFKTEEIDGESNPVYCGSISKTMNAKSCNQDMLVMWFNYGHNKSYTDILDNNSAFYIKNVDECRHVIISHVLRVGGQEFDKTTYEDSGFPKITDYLDGKSLTTPKYSGETSYNGHKIKYAVSGDTIPTNTLIDNNELVELYFPHYSVSGDNVTEVKNIAEGAFSGNTRLSAVTFNQIETISANAFTNCSALEHIDWGHSFCDEVSKVKTIGRKAFMDCPTLNYVKLPDSLLRIGNEAFSNTMQDSDSSCLYIPISLSGTTSDVALHANAFYSISPKCIVWNIYDGERRGGIKEDGLLAKNDSSDYYQIFKFGNKPVFCYFPNIKNEKSLEIISQIIGDGFPSGSKIYVGMDSTQIDTLDNGIHYFSEDTEVKPSENWTVDGFSTNWPYNNP